MSGVRVTADRDDMMPQTGLIIECATNGGGAALLERRLIEEELRDERLVAPLGFHRIEGGPGAFVPAATQDKAAVRAFVDWLKPVAQVPLRQYGAKCRAARREPDVWR